MRSNKKLNRRERLQQVLIGGGLPNWLPNQEVYVIFQENDEQKYLIKGRDGEDIYLNEAAFDTLEADIQKTGKQILLIKTERLEVLQKIVDEGLAMAPDPIPTQAPEPGNLPRGGNYDTQPEPGEPSVNKLTQGNADVHDEKQHSSDGSKSETLTLIDPEPVPEPETTLFKQTSEAEIYLQRRAQSIRKTHL